MPERGNENNPEPAKTVPREAWVRKGATREEKAKGVIYGDPEDRVMGEGKEKLGNDYIARTARWARGSKEDKSYKH